MNCLKCSSKACKTQGKDCLGNADEVVSLYNRESQRIYENADKIISEGMAQMPRVEEVGLYCKKQGYEIVSIGYCYSMEKEASFVASYLEEKGIKVLSYRCTMGGVRENEICNTLSPFVGCNPMGQAQAINKDEGEFVIEMGLCMGHDVIFHSNLKKPFTVLAVKDRVYKHNPLAFCKEEK